MTRKTTWDGKSMMEQSMCRRRGLEEASFNGMVLRVEGKEGVKRDGKGRQATRKPSIETLLCCLCVQVPIALPEPSAITGLR